MMIYEHDADNRSKVGGWILSSHHAASSSTDVCYVLIVGNVKLITVLLLVECGGVIKRAHGYIALESYPNNARCEWTVQVESGNTIELR